MPGLLDFLGKPEIQHGLLGMGANMLQASGERGTFGQGLGRGFLGFMQGYGYGAETEARKKERERQALMEKRRMRLLKSQEKRARYAAELEREKWNREINAQKKLEEDLQRLSKAKTPGEAAKIAMSSPSLVSAGLAYALRDQSFVPDIQTKREGTQTVSGFYDKQGTWHEVGRGPAWDPRSHTPTPPAPWQPNMEDVHQAIAREYDSMYRPVFGSPPPDAPTFQEYYAKRMPEIMGAYGMNVPEGAPPPPVPEGGLLGEPQEVEKQGPGLLQKGLDWLRRGFTGGVAPPATAAQPQAPASEGQIIQGSDGKPYRILETYPDGTQLLQSLETGQTFRNNPF